MAKRTCHEPEDISQTAPLKWRASFGSRCIAFIAGAKRAASPVSGNDATRTAVASLAVSTSSDATPGMTVGGRIVTNNSYGPALTRWYTSLLPTCANVGIATRMSVSHSKRRFIVVPRASSVRTSAPRSLLPLRRRWQRRDPRTIARRIAVRETGVACSRRRCVR